jgi:chemotaxis signal transduction protein
VGHCLAEDGRNKCARKIPQTIGIASAELAWIVTLRWSRSSRTTSLRVFARMPSRTTDYVSAVGRFGERLVLLVDLERALRVAGAGGRAPALSESVEDEGRG